MVFIGGGDIQEEVAVQVRGDGSSLMQTLNTAESGLMSLKGVIGAVGGALIGLSGLLAGKAVNAARSFEEQMVELEKVTDAQTAREMGDAIQDMAERIPLAHKELSEIAAQAGRLGIEGTENIREFTEVTAKMAVSTDLAADEAANAFARITQLTGTPIENVEELGSAINELGNTASTSSSEITDSVLRSGAAMSQLGLSTEEILGVSTALNEVSESSERAGTRLRRVAQELMDPGKVEDLAGALGMSAEEFKTMRDESPLQLIQQMVGAFAEGGETADVLRSTLSTTSRQAISALSQNIEGLNSALDVSHNQFENATSLTEEFIAANSTFNSELQRTKSRLRNIAIETGETLLPHLSRLLDHVNSGLEAFGKLNEETDGMAGTVGILGTALAGVVLVIGALVSLLGGPVVAAIGAAIAIGAALATAWESNFLGIRDHVADAVTRIEGIMERLGPLFEAVEGILNNFSVAWEMVGGDVTTILSAMLDAWLGLFTTFLDGLVTFVTIIAQLLNGDFAGALETFTGFWKRTFNGLLEFVDEWGDDLLAAVLRIVAGVIEGAGSNLESFLSGIPGVSIGTGDLTPDALVADIRQRATRLEQGPAGGAAGLTPAEQQDIVVTVEGDTDVVKDVAVETYQQEERRVFREDRRLRSRGGD